MWQDKADKPSNDLCVIVLVSTCSIEGWRNLHSSEPPSSVKAAHLKVVVFRQLDSKGEPHVDRLEGWSSALAHDSPHGRPYLVAKHVKLLLSLHAPSASSGSVLKIVLKGVEVSAKTKRFRNCQLPRIQNNTLANHLASVKRGCIWLLSGSLPLGGKNVT